MFRKIWGGSGWVAAGLLLMVATGCSAPRITETARSAVEEFLISTVVENAVGAVDFKDLKDKKVFIEYDYLAPQVDKPYVQGVVELTLAENKAIVVRDVKEADVLLQVLCGVLATDTNKFTIGTPALPIPVPDTGISFGIPEIPLFQKLTRTGYASFAFNMVEAATRKPIRTVRDIDSSAYYTNWTILLIPFKSHDLALDVKKGAQTSFNVDWQ